jgi:predicted metal-dependent RNase
LASSRVIFFGRRYGEATARHLARHSFFYRNAAPITVFKQFIRARYWNAGHLLGSASFEIEFAGEVLSGQPLRILASGDIGPDAKLLQPNPEAPTGFDYLISETTSGNTDRPPTTSQERRQRLGTHVRDASGVIRILATIIVLRGADQEDARLR